TTTGTLPPGLSLSSSGALSGTPTTAGTYKFTVTATDTRATFGPFTVYDDPAGFPGTTVIHSISGSNIVGTYQDSTGQHGFVFDGSTYTTLDDPDALPGTTAVNGISGDEIV